jgi:DNA-damage-inducible protein D
MKQSPFESTKHLDSHGQEYWSARELYPLLGYTNWNKFQDVIQRAQDAIKTSNAKVEDHFYPEVKLISAGK